MLQILQKYFGEEEATETLEQTETAETETKESPTSKDGKEEVFTKTQIEKIIQTRLKNQKQEQEKLLTKLNELQKSENLTKEERDNLAKQKEELENSLMSEQEKAAKQKKQLENQFQEKASALEKERDEWKDRFESSLNRRALIDAATHKEVDAISPSQIEMMFRGSTYSSPDTNDEGKPTGSYTARTKFMGLDKDGKLVEFDLPTLEALKKIKKDDQNPNLFKHGGTPGTGQSGTGTSPGKKQGDRPRLEDYPNKEEFQSAYFKWRETHTLDGREIKQE